MSTMPMLSRSTYCTFLLALLALLPASASRAQTAAASGTDDKERVYDLPTYTVTAARIQPPPEQWRYTLENGFEILSNADDSTTQNLFKQIGEYINVLGSISPNMKPKTNLPIKFIICGQRGFFSQFSDNLTTPVLSTQDGDQILFVINTSGDFMISLTSSDMNADDMAAYITTRVFKQYIDLRMAQVNPPLPPWFQQAMRSLYANMHFTGKNVTFAQVSSETGGWGEYAASDILSELSTPSEAAKKTTMENGGDTNSAFDYGSASATADIAADVASANNDMGDDNSNADPNADQAQRPQQQQETGQIIMPMAKFLTFDPNNPDATITDGKTINVRTWSRQCVMFVHYCLYGRRASKLQAPFLKFLAACSTGPTDEALFKQLFKESYKDMELDLGNYREYTDSKTMLYQFKDDTRPAPLNLQDATPAQIARMKGEAKIILGKTDEGYNDMLTTYMKKKDGQSQADPLLYAALGLYEYKAGNTDKARPLLENAVKDKAPRPEAYRALSKLHFDEIMAGKPADYKLTNDELMSVITPLMAVRTIPPSDLQTYIMLGEALRDADRPATKDEAAALLEGYNRYPSDPNLTILAAQTMMRGKYYIPARLLVQRGLKQSGQSEAWHVWLQQADDELAKLPPETFAPPAPAAQPQQTQQPAQTPQKKSGSKPKKPAK